MSDQLGDRMKRFEDACRYTLTPRMPIIIRVDGKAFHSLLRKAERPWDAAIEHAMNVVAIELCIEAQGACLAYVQSDEVSVLLHPYKTHQTQPWLSGSVQKIASISSSIATLAFNSNAPSAFAHAYFDARVFVVPEPDVCNAMLWRQKDAERNSIQMLARHHFSYKQVFGKSCSELQEMLFKEKNINWNDTPTGRKRGRCAIRETYEREGAIRYRWVIDNEIPLFSTDRGYIEKHLVTEEDKQ